MTLGEAIKQRRKEVGLTQAALAEKAGIHRSYLAGVEIDRYNPSLKTLVNILSVLGIDTVCLLGMTGY